MDDEPAAGAARFEHVNLDEGSGEQKHCLGVLRKVKLVDRGINLERLGRHLKLFTDKVEPGLDNETKRLLAKKTDLTKATDEQREELIALGAAGDSGRSEG